MSIFNTAAARHEEIVLSFERAWASGARPRLDDFLPAEESLRRGVLVDLVHADLEFRLKAGEFAPVEAYLARHAELAADRDAVRDLVAQEYFLRRRLGTLGKVSLDEYGWRFPDLADSLAQRLEPSDTDGGDLELTWDNASQTLCRRDEVTPSPSRPDERSRTERDRSHRTSIGDYEILRELGTGGMGVVFLARHMKLDRLVALKMVRAGVFAGRDELERFQREAQAAATLDHPGIVPIYEVGEHDGQPYFSLAYVEGQSLSDRVADGPLPPREAADLILQVAEAVQYANEKGVIHRDLKPGNILIDSFGRPRVTDFGLAKRLKSGDEAKTEGGEEGQRGGGEEGTHGPSPATAAYAQVELTVTGQILGTPNYMPPEQASGKSSEIGPASDVYALGATLYHLSTGRPPFQSADPWDTLRQVMETEPVPPRRLNASIPRDLETIALKCLEKSPESRFPNARELADDLARFVAGEPIKARRIGRVARCWRWCRRNPALALAGGSSLAAVIATVVVSLTFAAHQRTAANRIRVEQEKTNRALANVQAQERIAQQNSADARAAVRNYVKAVQDEGLLADEQWQPLRRRLLEHALSYNQAFVRKNERSPAARRDLALALFDVAEIHRSTGSRPDALKAYDQARGVFESMIRAGAATRDDRYQLAKLYHNLALASLDQGSVERADRYYAQAASIKEQLVREDPTELELEHSRISTILDDGHVKRQLGQWDLALEAYRRAQALAEARLDGDGRFERLLARACLQSGIALRRTGRASEADNAYRRALAIQEQLSALDPDDLKLRLDLSMTLNNLCNLAWDEGDLTEAIELDQRALAIRVELVERAPLDVNLKWYLGKSLLHFAEGLRDVGRVSDAKRHAIEAARVLKPLTDEAGRDVAWLHNLAQAHSLLGEIQAGEGELAPAMRSLDTAFSLVADALASNWGHVDLRFEMSQILATYGRVHWQLGNLYEAASYLREAIRHGQFVHETTPSYVPYRATLAQYHGVLAHVTSELGQFVESRHAALEHLRLLNKTVDRLNAETGPGP